MAKLNWYTREEFMHHVPSCAGTNEDFAAWAFMADHRVQRVAVERMSDPIMRDMKRIHVRKGRFFGHMRPLERLFVSAEISQMSAQWRVNTYFEVV